jgi:hypothetical protein
LLPPDACVTAVVSVASPTPCLLVTALPAVPASRPRQPSLSSSPRQPPPRLELGHRHDARAGQPVPPAPERLRHGRRVGGVACAGSMGARGGMDGFFSPQFGTRCTGPPHGPSESIRPTDVTAHSCGRGAWDMRCGFGGHTLPGPPTPRRLAGLAGRPGGGPPAEQRSANAGANAGATRGSGGSGGRTGRTTPRPRAGGATRPWPRQLGAAGGREVPRVRTHGARVRTHRMGGVQRGQAGAGGPREQWQEGVVMRKWTGTA